MTTTEYRGRLRVSETAISEISAAAVCETGSAVCRKNDVFVRYTGGTVEINISLMMKKDARASVCAETVQNAVRDSVQNMTGVTVSRINVKICGQV